MINATWPWKLGAHMYVHKELFHHDKYFVKLWWSLRSTSWWLPGWSVLTACLLPTFISSSSPTPVGCHQMVPHPNLPTASWNVGKGGEIEKALCGVFSSKKNMCFLSYNCSSVHRPIPFNAFEIVGEKGIFASSVPQTLEKRSASAFISSPERALWLGHAIKTLSTHNTHTWYLSPVPHAAQV